jgi:hypothetical protein
VLVAGFAPPSFAAVVHSSEEEASPFWTPIQANVSIQTLSVVMRLLLIMKENAN